MQDRKGQVSNMGQHADRAEALFYEGYNCSQAVFGAFAEEYGFDRETALKLASSFGAGMGRMREICGAFSGILMVCGLETGSADGSDQERKAANYREVQRLAALFKERNGSLQCAQLLGLDKQQVQQETIEPAERTAEYYKKRPCADIIRHAALLIEEEILNHRR